MRKLTFVLLLGACAGSPANVAGNYTLAVVSGANGCNFSGWTQGNTTQGVPLTITQNDTHITGVVGGAVGTYMTALLGSATFTGSVDENQISMLLYGTRPNVQGNCTITINVRVTGSASGDFLSGTVDYTPSTNGNPDCASVQGCHSTQSFNGTRPPTQ